MLDQSYNPDCFFGGGCAVVSNLYLYQETVLLNRYFMFSGNLMLLFLDKVATGT